MTPGYLPFHPDPKAPEFEVPAGAVDAHCHVFGPAGRFPFAPERKYTPVDAPKERLFALRDHLGFERNVIVQASCHGRDNRALVDALLAADDRARGVAIVDAEASDRELADLGAAGVRAVRFNFLRRLVDATPREVFHGIAERVTALGWHVVVYFEAADLPDLIPFLEALPGTVVVDHMAMGVESAGFRAFLDFMTDHLNVWVKVSCLERLTVAGPPYDDVVPFARTLVERFADRVLWGTDWPHPNMRSHMPDDGQLVDLIALIAPGEAEQRALLVDNPTRLYWPDVRETER
jgi:2-pyrone-4,6-dicarboxylate lactonase